MQIFVIGKSGPPKSTLPKRRILAFRRDFYRGKVWDTRALRFVPKDDERSNIAARDQLLVVGMENGLVRLVAEGVPECHILVPISDTEEVQVGSLILP